MPVLHVLHVETLDVSCSDGGPFKDNADAKDASNL